MNFHSNLSAPDLTNHFRNLHKRPMAHSQGHDVFSDFADRPVNDPVFGLYKNCGFWTTDEAAILYHCVRRCPGEWLDLGCHTGWTAGHQAEAGAHVIAVDNMLCVDDFKQRFMENTVRWKTIAHFCGTTNEYFDITNSKFDGVVVDADHGEPNPVSDAMNAADRLNDTGVILLHDFIGKPVWLAAVALMDRGFKCKVYWTPHMVACCYRGNFTPPEHQRDTAVDWSNVQGLMRGFPFERCEA